MIDKLKTFFDNHKWFRVFCYILEFIVFLIDFWIFILVLYNWNEYSKTIGEIDIYNNMHMIFFGCACGLFYLFAEFVDYIERVYNRITNRNKIDK